MTYKEFYRKFMYILAIKKSWPSTATDNLMAELANMPISEDEIERTISEKDLELIIDNYYTIYNLDGDVKVLRAKYIGLNWRGCYAFCVYDGNDTINISVIPPESKHLIKPYVEEKPKEELQLVKGDHYNIYNEDGMICATHAEYIVQRINGDCLFKSDNFPESFVIVSPHLKHLIKPCDKPDEIELIENKFYTIVDKNNVIKHMWARYAGKNSMGNYVFEIEGLTSGFNPFRAIIHRKHKHLITTCVTEIKPKQKVIDFPFRSGDTVVNINPNSSFAYRVGEIVELIWDGEHNPSHFAVRYYAGARMLLQFSKAKHFKKISIEG